MNEAEMLIEQDLVWVLRRLPKDVFKLLKDSEGKVFLAGGFVRDCICGDKPSDIDLFSESTVMARMAAEALAKSRDCRMISTVNAYTVVGPGLSVQFIHKWTFQRPQDVIPSFDFTIARAAIWFDAELGKWVSKIDKSFYADLAAKRLVYCSPDRIEEAGGSMLRVLKFYRRGYRIPLDSLGAVIARLARGIHLCDGMVETETVEGMRRDVVNEAQFAKVATGLLREVDPSIDPTNQAHLPSSLSKDCQAMDGGADVNIQA